MTEEIPLSDADMATLERNLQKAPPTIKRHLIGGPMNGKDCWIPSDVTTNDVGWWTMHYLLQPDGTMHWKSKVTQPDFLL